MSGRSRLDRYQNLRSGASDKTEVDEKTATLRGQSSSAGNYPGYRSGYTRQASRSRLYQTSEYDSLLKEHEDFLKSLDEQFGALDQSGFSTVEKVERITPGPQQPHFTVQPSSQEYGQPFKQEYTQQFQQPVYEGFQHVQQPYGQPATQQDFIQQPYVQPAQQQYTQPMQRVMPEQPQQYVQQPYGQPVPQQGYMQPPYVQSVQQTYPEQSQPYVQPPYEQPMSQQIYRQQPYTEGFQPYIQQPYYQPAQPEQQQYVQPAVEQVVEKAVEEKPIIEEQVMKQPVTDYIDEKEVFKEQTVEEQVVIQQPQSAERMTVDPISQLEQPQSVYQQPTLDIRQPEAETPEVEEVTVKEEDKPSEEVSVPQMKETVVFGVDGVEEEKEQKENDIIFVDIKEEKQAEQEKIQETEEDKNLDLYNQAFQGLLKLYPGLNVKKEETESVGISKHEDLSTVEEVIEEIKDIELQDDELAIADKSIEDIAEEIETVEPVSVVEISEEVLEEIAADELPAEVKIEEITDIELQDDELAIADKSIEDIAEEIETVEPVSVVEISEEVLEEIAADELPEEEKIEEITDLKTVEESIEPVNLTEELSDDNTQEIEIIDEEEYDLCQDEPLTTDIAFAVFDDIEEISEEELLELEPVEITEMVVEDAMNFEFGYPELESEDEIDSQTQEIEVIDETEDFDLTQVDTDDNHYEDLESEKLDDITDETEKTFEDLEEFDETQEIYIVDDMEDYIVDNYHDNLTSDERLDSKEDIIKDLDLLEDDFIKEELDGKVIEIIDENDSKNVIDNYLQGSTVYSDNDDREKIDYTIETHYDEEEEIDFFEEESLIDEIVENDVSQYTETDVFKFIDDILVDVKNDAELIQSHNDRQEFFNVEEEKTIEDISRVLSGWDLEDMEFVEEESIMPKLAEDDINIIDEALYEATNPVHTPVYYDDPVNVDQLTQKLENERVLRQQMLEQTKQIKLQVREYEDELESVNSSMSKTNKILNFVLTLLIMTLFVILFVIGFWFAQERGLI